MANQKKRAASLKRGTAPRSRRSGSAISMFTFYLNRGHASSTARRKLITRVKSEPREPSDERDERDSRLA